MSTRTLADGGEWRPLGNLETRSVLQLDCDLRSAGPVVVWMPHVELAATVASKMGHRVTGIHVSPEAAGQMRWNSEHFGVDAEFRIADARNPYHPKGSLDLVIAVDVLQNLYDPGKVATARTELLGPGGRLMIKDGNYLHNSTLESYNGRRNHCRTKYGKGEMQNIDYDSLRSLCERPCSNRVRCRHGSCGFFSSSDIRTYISRTRF